MFSYLNFIIYDDAVYEVKSKTNCIQSMAPQGAEGEDFLLKKEAREAHLELLLCSIFPLQLLCCS
jgi:hypothetical protein